MSEKYCPVGKIECVEVRIIPNMPVLFDVKYCNAADCNIGGCETCPCPSKQKPEEVEEKEDVDKICETCRYGKSSIKIDRCNTCYGYHRWEKEAKK